MNRYAAPCTRCGAMVKPFGGVLVREGGAWTVQHAGSCAGILKRERSALDLALRQPGGTPCAA